MSTDTTNKKVKSMRGDIVDFDLFDIKSQIIDIKASDLAQERSELIRTRRKRASSNAKINDMIAEKILSENKKVEVEIKVEDVGVSTPTNRKIKKNRA